MTDANVVLRELRTAGPSEHDLPINPSEQLYPPAWSRWGIGTPITKSGARTHMSPSALDRHVQWYLPHSPVNTDGGEVVGFDAYDLPDLLGPR